MRVSKERIVEHAVAGIILAAALGFCAWIFGWFDRELTRRDIETAARMLIEEPELREEFLLRLSSVMFPVLKANTLAILDKEGQTRVIVGTATNGGGRLECLDSNGITRVQVQATDSGAAINLSHNQASRVELSFDETKERADLILGNMAPGSDASIHVSRHGSNLALGNPALDRFVHLIQQSNDGHQTARLHIGPRGRGMQLCWRDDTGFTITRPSTIEGPDDYAQWGNEICAPVGTIAAWMSENRPPDGWHVCDNTPIVDLGLTAEERDTLRVQSIIRNDRLPDLRGYFLRGAGKIDDQHESGLLGEEQSDAVGPHQHTLPRDTGGIEGKAGGDKATSSDHGTRNRETGGVRTGGGTETRPINIAVHWIIRVR